MTRHSYQSTALPTAVVTGANAGLGLEVCRELARRGQHVVMVCRSRRRGGAARQELIEDTDSRRIDLEVSDLASLAQVERLAEHLRDYPPIDQLILNAGVYRSSRELTADGFEETMAVNHLAHHLLTLRLREHLSDRARVVVVSSEAHRRADLRRQPLEATFRGEGDYRAMRAYCDSKLANVLFARELARRWRGEGVVANAIHPGVLATRIWNRNRDPLSLVLRLFKPMMRHPRRGAEAVVHLATSPDLEEVSGHYFDLEEPKEPSEAALDDALASELWEASARAVGLGEEAAEESRAAGREGETADSEEQ